MLAVVLAGIGLGGIAGGAIYRRIVRPHKLLPLLLVIAAIATLLSYLFFPIPALQGNPANILRSVLEADSSAFA